MKSDARCFISVSKNVTSSPCANRGASAADQLPQHRVDNPLAGALIESLYGGFEPWGPGRKRTL